MNKLTLANIARFWLILFLQLFILKGMGEDIGQIDVYIYPIFIMLLPLQLPLASILILAFIYGLFIDMFYDNDGLHAACLVLVAFIRPLVCALLEPRRGYEIQQTLTRYSMGLRWFVQYSAIMIGIHTFALVTLEELSFSITWLLRLVLTFSLSLLFIILYQFIFPQKQ
ncbi:MAG: rod shape-determining protein MreD [Saprospiraceae bacterium]|nr:rod shape-determining protein MreD [Saprospiraceae bacterium]